MCLVIAKIAVQAAFDTVGGIKGPRGLLVKCSHSSHCQIAALKLAGLK